MVFNSALKSYNKYTVYRSNDISIYATEPN